MRIPLKPKIIATLILTALVAIAASPSGPGTYSPMSPKIAHAGFFSQDLELFEEVVDLVSDKYVYPPDYRKLFEGAFEGMVAFVDDKELIHQKAGAKGMLRWKGRNLPYRLTYNFKDNMNALKKAYYFLAEGMDEKSLNRDLEFAGINGMMETLDLYSQFMDQSMFDRSMRDTEGKYGGLGMLITMKDKRLEVVKTMPNSPARKAGILSGDLFVKADGRDVKDTQIEDLAEMLRGYPDTRVSISLERPSEKKIYDYELTRKTIEIESVHYEKLAGPVGHIRITSFSKQTDEQLIVALQQAKKDRVRGYILDLRDNPGGLLTQSVKVAGHFLSPNRLVVYTQGRTRSNYQEYRSEIENTLHEKPIVALINGNSASASEIVAGALRDVGLALVLGETSYGKGSVQTIFRISEGAGLRLTTSKYYTPSGIDITEHGIIPDIMVEDDQFETEKTADTNTEVDAVFQHKKSPLPGYPSIRMKLSDVEKLVRSRGIKLDEEHDPLLGFAQMSLENIVTADKLKTLEHAKELAANIIY